MKVFEDNNIVIYKCETQEEAIEVSLYNSLRVYSKTIQLVGLSFYVIATA